MKALKTSRNTLRSAFLLAALAAAIVTSAASCNQQGEGEPCDPRNANNDCASGLQCSRGYRGYVCCPPGVPATPACDPSLGVGGGGGAGGASSGGQGGDAGGAGSGGQGGDAGGAGTGGQGGDAGGAGSGGQGGGAGGAGAGGEGGAGTGGRGGEGGGAGSRR